MTLLCRIERGRGRCPVDAGAPAPEGGGKRGVALAPHRRITAEKGRESGGGRRVRAGGRLGLFPPPGGREGGRAAAGVRGGARPRRGVGRQPDQVGRWFGVRAALIVMERSA